MPDPWTGEEDKPEVGRNEEPEDEPCPAPIRGGANAQEPGQGDHIKKPQLGPDDPENISARSRRRVG